MNRPAYILVEEMAAVVERVRLALSLPVLNYQYGYRKEIYETLTQWAKTPEFAAKKFPMVYVAQPFTVRRDDPVWYGETTDLRIFILHHTSKTYKAAERLAQVYKPVIYPIYTELLRQIALRGDVFDTYGLIPHDDVDYYYWGEGDKTAFTDVVDCKTLFNLRLKINNNLNCVVPTGPAVFV